MPVLCPSCGTVGGDADATCVACGGDLAADPVALVAADVAAPPARADETRTAPLAHRARHRGAIVAVVLVAVAVAATTVVLLTRDTSGPQTTWAGLRVRVPSTQLPARVQVVGIGPRGQVRLADLATGRVRELRRAHQPVRATTVVARGDVVVVQEPDGRVEAFADITRDAPRVTRLGRADVVVAGADPDRIWLARGSRVSEMGTDGRSFTSTTLPTGYRVAGGALDHDALLLAGTTRADSVVWDPDTRAIVSGTRSGPALAGAAGTVITTACGGPVNTCHALAVDLRTRTNRALDAPVWDGFDSPVIVARLSPDGRYAAFGEAFPGHHDVHARMTLVDTHSGRVLWTHDVAPSSSEPTAWDDRSDLVFFTDGLDAFVHHVDGPAGNLVSLGPVRELDAVAVLPRRSGSPAAAALG